MKIRVGKLLAGKLAWQREYMGDGAGAVFARALRKWRRLGEPGDRRPRNIEESTYHGSVVTVDAPDGWSADQVRALLWWHLADVPDEPPARFVPPGVPGKDYTVEEWADY